MVNSKPANSV